MADSIVNSSMILEDALNSAYELNNPIGNNVLNQWLNPGQQQEREFGQQVALQDAQNQWNSEVEKMRRMEKAGINPATAAGAVAGSGSAPATASPNSAVGSGASLPAAVGSLAENVASGVGAYEKLSLTPVEREKRSAETVAALEAAGFDHWQAKAIEIMLPDRQKNLQADTYLKIANFKNVCEEYQNIVLEHDQRKADIDLKQKQAYQAEKSGNLAEAQRLNVEAQTELLSFNKWWAETEKQFWIDNGYKSDDPLDVSLRNAAANNKTEAAEAVGNAIETYNYRTEVGIKTADVENAYKEAYDEAKANADVAALFKEFNVDVDAWKEIFVDGWKSYLENPDSLKGTVSKFFNQLVIMLDRWKASVHFEGSPNGNRVGSHDKPAAGSRYGK